MLFSQFTDLLKLLASFSNNGTIGRFKNCRGTKIPAEAKWDGEWEEWTKTAALRCFPCKETFQIICWEMRQAGVPLPHCSTLSKFHLPTLTSRWPQNLVHTITHQRVKLRVELTNSWQCFSASTIQSLEGQWKLLMTAELKSQQTLVLWLLIAKLSSRAAGRLSALAALSQF